MESADQLQAEVKRQIALYVGGIGSILLGAAFLFFESFLIRRDNLSKTRLKAEALHRESVRYKKKAEEQELQEKTENVKRTTSGSSDDDGDDDSDLTEPIPGAVQGGEKHLNGFFHRESVASNAGYDQTTEKYNKVPEVQILPDIRSTDEFVQVENTGAGRRDSAVDFKDTLAAALQNHMLNLRRDSSASSRRPSFADGIDSCRSSVTNSRRPSIADIAIPQSSHKSSLSNSRRPSAVNMPEAARTAPDYESLKFMAGQNIDDGREPPRYDSVVNRSRRGSLENQLAPTGNLTVGVNERRPSKTFEVVTPLSQSFDANSQSYAPGPSATSDPLPSIPESPFLPNKRQKK